MVVDQFWALTIDRMLSLSRNLLWYGYVIEVPRLLTVGSEFKSGVAGGIVGFLCSGSVCFSVVWLSWGIGVCLP